MEREKLKLTSKQAREIIYGDSLDYTIIKDEIVDHGRWTVSHEVVIQRHSDGKYFSDGYREAATESQDEKPFEFCEPNFTEVFPVEKTITVYE